MIMGEDVLKRIVSEVSLRWTNGALPKMYQYVQSFGKRVGKESSRLP